VRIVNSNYQVQKQNNNNEVLKIFFLLLKCQQQEEVQDKVRDYNYKIMI